MFKYKYVYRSYKAQSSYFKFGMPVAGVRLVGLRNNGFYLLRRFEVRSLTCHSVIGVYKVLHSSFSKAHVLLIDMATTCTSSSIDVLSKCNSIGLVNSESHTSDDGYYFAFARINDEVYLVQGKHIYNLFF
jgi:hypothetical protein